MRVDDMQNFDIKQSNVLKTPGTGDSPRKTGWAESAASSSDQAETTAYRSLVALALHVGNSSQNSRVEELRNQIQTGQYSVDLPLVGKAIVNAALNYD